MPLTLSSVKREHVEAFIVDQLRRHKPATASVRYRGLQGFFKWAEEEGEVAQSPMTRMKPPKVTEPALILPDDLLKLLEACQGTSFDQRRDTAIIMLFLDTGLRLSEMSGIQLDDLDMRETTISIIDKEGKHRLVPFGRRTAVAIDRYRRTRKLHPRADALALWLGRGGGTSKGSGPMTATGVAQMIRRRAEQAGLKRIHPHMFRHLFAHMWQVADREADLMSITGWSSFQMVRRYARTAASERTIQAHRQLSPGDRLG